MSEAEPLTATVTGHGFGNFNTDPESIARQMVEEIVSGLYSTAEQVIWASDHNKNWLSASFKITVTVEKIRI